MHELQPYSDLQGLALASGPSVPFSSEAFEPQRQMFSVLRAAYSSAFVHEQFLSTSVLLSSIDSADDIAKQTAEMLATLELPTDPKINKEVDALIARTAKRNNRRRAIVRKR